MTRQLDVWEGEFGKAYTNRNVVDWRSRLPAFREMLCGLEVSRVLEVGCNRGHNLLAVREIIGAGAEVVGVEPNEYALEVARSSSVQIAALRGSCFDLPFRDGYFDLAFTCGVLIHIALGDLPEAMSEMVRVSKRYILALEAYAEEESVIHYRGHDDLLWKRDFLTHYQTSFPALTLVRNGYWGPEDGFDRAHWWLLAKGDMGTA